MEEPRAIRIPLTQVESWRVWLYNLNLALGFATRLLTVVALALLVSVLSLTKSCITPQQLPAGIGTPPLEAPPQSMPPHNAPKSF